MSLLAVVVGAATAGASSLAVPWIVRSVPEPEPESDTEPAEPVLGADAEPAEADAGEPPAPTEPKEPYAAIAAVPGLAPLSALAGGAIGALLGWAVGWSWSLLLVLPLVAVGIALAVIDWRTRLLPTFLITPVYVGLAVLSLVVWVLTRDTDALVRGGLGWLAAGLFFFALWWVYPAGLGFGDVRLSGALGMMLGHFGWGALVVGLYAGFLLGGLVGLVLVRLGVVDRKHNPFGPWMLIGALLGVLVGGPVAEAAFPTLT